jgi:hypothetical protein
MYIPETGQAVYVVAKPSTPIKPGVNIAPSTPGQIPNPSLSPSEAAGLTLPGTTPGSSIIPRSPAPTYHSRAHTLPQGVIPNDHILGPIPFPSVLEEEPPPPPPPKEPNYRPSLRPPPLDHVPDEEELERRRRGDAQPQLIPPRDWVKFSTSVMGNTPGDANAAEDKFLIPQGAAGLLAQQEARREGLPADRRSI